MGWNKKVLEVNKATLIKEVLDNKTNLDYETKRDYGTLTKLQETRELIKKTMNKIKEEETKRICKEVLCNDYLRRFKVSQRHLFASVVGEDQAIMQIAILKQEYLVIKIINF